MWRDPEGFFFVAPIAEGYGIVIPCARIAAPYGRGTEAVTTAPTRNRLGAKRPTWVRIPPSPPIPQQGPCKGPFHLNFMAT